MIPGLHRGTREAIPGFGTPGVGPPLFSGGALSPPVTSKATFELYEDRDGKYRWRLVHDNGNIVADSGEGYSRKTDAVNGIESVKSNAPDAPVEEVEWPTDDDGPE